MTPTVNIVNNHNIKKYLYDLYGVIIHCGNLEGGHYTCYFRRSNSKNIMQHDDVDNPWYYFNDDKTEKSSWNNMIRELLFTPSTTIKMVFLSKHNEYHECDHFGLDHVASINKSLRLEEYEKYYPEDLVGYSEYYDEHPAANQFPIIPPINPSNPLFGGTECRKCGKYYYPFTSPE